MEGALGVCKEIVKILKLPLPVFTFERETGRVGRRGALSDLTKSEGLKAKKRMYFKYLYFHLLSLSNTWCFLALCPEPSWN